ncbi:MAG: HEAT repeat domain-containing protein [Chitinophagaceae bacterium]|nr:HEAT repeat domain-containing protein [Oligoflexus sp.]
MKKNHVLILTGIALILVVIGFAVFRYIPKNALSSEAKVVVPKVADEYSVRMTTLLKTPDSEKTILDLEGVLESRLQNTNETTTTWLSFGKFVSGEKTVDPKDMIGQTTDSKALDGTLQNFLSLNFPQPFISFQDHFLTKLLLPFTLSETKHFFQNELEEKSLIRVEYTIDRLQDGFGVRRSWGQTIRGSLKTDEKSNTLYYVFDAQSILQKMGGDLAFFTESDKGDSYIVRTHFDVSHSGSKQIAVTDQKTVDRSQLVLVSDLNKSNDADGKKILPISEILEAVKKLNSKNTPQERADAFMALADALDADPKLLSSIKTAILGLDPQTNPDAEGQMNVLFSVLAGAEIPAVSDTLADLLQTDCKNELCRENAIGAYGQSSSMTPDSARRVLRVAETEAPDTELSFKSYMGASLAGNVLGDKFPELVPSLNTALNAADAKDDLNTKNGIIRAIGNTGSRDLLPGLTENLKAPAASTRKLAYYSLRFIPGADIDKTLIDALEKEQDAVISLEILRALSVRQLSKEMCDRIAAKTVTWPHDDRDLTLSAVNTLLDVYEHNPAYSRNGLTLLAEKLESEDMRKYIRDKILSKTDDSE